MKQVLSKQSKPVLLFFFSFLLLLSCEEVVDVEVDSITPRLVVEADIEWERGEVGNEQFIKLSESSDYFNEQYVPAENATVTLTKLNTNQSFSFQYIANGLYKTSLFVPELNADYRLDITYKGENYQATSTLMPVTPVTRVEQNRALGFDGSEVASIDFYTNDPAGIANYYFVTYQRGSNKQYLSIWDDNFRDGNEINFIYRYYFSDDETDFESGEEINIEYMGVDKDFYDFMFLLTEQAYSGGDPFASTPVQLKGNVKNLSNGNRNAFGYFRLSQKDTFTVVVE